MKLMSSAFREKSIELIFADNTDLAKASTLLHMRLPREIDHSKSLAWNRYYALQELRNLVHAQMEAEQQTSPGIA